MYQTSRKGLCSVCNGCGRCGSLEQIAGSALDYAGTTTQY